MPQPRQATPPSELQLLPGVVDVWSADLAVAGGPERDLLSADEQARAVDLVEVEPASGAASAHRVVIPEPEPADAAGRP